VQRSHVDVEEATWPGKRMSVRELIGLGMGEQCPADAASHGSIQVGHVCETRESVLMDGARLAVR
jgi:acyl-[acyl carrier protein]--UDP-N-acetylglucosamine O-acyltransferase